MPPTRIAFLYSNKYVAATLSASSSATALPVTASQNEDRSYVWQSLTQTGVQTIDIDLGSVLPVSAVALANLRLLSGGALEVYQRGDAAAPGAATLVTTLPAANSFRRTTFAFFASQSHRHWQFKWTNPGVVSDYAQLGYAFVGVEYETTVNIQVPSDLSWIDPSVSKSSVGGQETFSIRQKVDVGEWSFDEIGETQLQALKTMYDTVGTFGAHFVVLDASLSWTCWYARFGSNLKRKLAILAGRYSLEIPWKEVA